MIKKVKYEQIDILIVNDIDPYGHTAIVFDISSKESKEFFKENFRFKLRKSETDEEIDVESSIINITKDRLFDRTVYFIKNNKVKFSLKIINGLITDYSKK